MRREDNSKFVQVMAGLIPRDLVLTVENESPLADIDPATKRAIAARILEQLAAEKMKVIDATSVQLTEEQSPDNEANTKD
jgi:hypothetical protein